MEGAEVMWEQFIPRGEREAYRSQIMEGPHGSSRRLEPHVIGWLWGFLFGLIAALIGLAAVMVLL